MMALLKRIGRAPLMQAAVGVAAAEYLRLVWVTSRFVVEPADVYERLEPELPVIFAFWHGQHFMVPFAKPAHYRAKVLISRHRDGEVNAIAAERLGVEAIRGSGDRERRFDRKGGVTAFMNMLTALQDNWSMALTADIPKVSRVAGGGIVKLAQISGRPIYPVAVATSGRITLNNWDRSVINLPFSRGAIVAGEPIRVPAEAAEAALEQARVAVEQGVNAATERAYAIVDRRSTNHG
ncbi:MAG: lysophospholipid acyltransferase family protein [Xanthobacteraceae bacterium]